MVTGALVVWAAEKDERVSMDQVPPKAREALLKLAGGAEIKEVEKETVNGVEVYEAEWMVDGKEREAKVTADGQPVKRRGEAKEEVITLEQAPAKAREAILKAAGDAKIIKVEKEMEDGAPAYEAEWKTNGKKHEIAVTAEGALISSEETVAAQDVPEAVRKAAEKRFPGAEKLVFTKEIEVSYEVTVVHQGKKHEIEISPGGQIEEDEDDDDGDGSEHQR